MNTLVTVIFLLTIMFYSILILGRMKTAGLNKFTIFMQRTNNSLIFPSVANKTLYLSMLFLCVSVICIRFFFPVLKFS